MAPDRDLRRILRALDEPAQASRLGSLVVVGVTCAEAPTDEREDVARQLAMLAPAFAERVLIHTCHRAELVGVASERPVEPPAGSRLASGLEAVGRVFSIAGGLDSAVVAEEQLLGQVRRAYERALAAGHSGPILNELFRRAIRFGRRVRSHAMPGGDRSLADRAVSWAIKRLPDREANSALVVGTGEMGRLLAEQLMRAGLRVTVSSRRVDRAARVAGELTGVGDRGATFASRDAALSRADGFALIALAVRGGGSLLGQSDLRGAWPLVIDLSTPAAVAPDLRAGLGDRVCDLDTLAARSGASALGAREDGFRAEVHEQALAFVEWLAERDGASAVRLLRALATEVRHRHVARFARDGRWDEDQLAAVDAMARAMLNEFLHQPTVRLRRGGEPAVGVLELFGLPR